MKLLLGEDMSGHGKGVSSALTLSNAITNLAGFFFNLFHFVLQISIRFLLMDDRRNHNILIFS